jgi:protein phosphatase
VVADGLGGHAGGDEASRLVVESVEASALAAESHSVDPAAWVWRLLTEVHHTLLREGGGEDQSSSMGSTATVAILSEDVLTLGHVGDTRCYRMRDGTLSQLTEDHSWVAEQQRAGVLSAEEAEAFEHRNWLTQSLGVGERLDIALYRETPQPSDRYLLCSDGLHGLVSDETMHAVLTEEADPEAAAERLVDLANEAGGTDNVTALVFDVHRLEAGATTLGADAATAAARPTRRGGGVLLLLGGLVLLGAAGLATARWTSRADTTASADSTTAPADTTTATIPDSTRMRVIQGAPADTSGDSGPNPQE